MPGEKMLKNIESVKGDDKIDAQELHNALKELDKGEITRGLNHKIDKIKSVDGIHDATRDLLTKIESDPSNLELSQDQIDGLHALHALLNPNEDGSTVNIKKIDKPEVINNVHFQNVKNAIEFEGSSYGFAGWEQGINDTPIVGSAEVLEGTSTMYFIPFTLDGKLDFSKGTSTTPGSIDVIARGFDGKALPNAEKKVAYMQDGKLVIEKSDVYAQKMKNKEFVEKLEDVTVPGLFLTKLLSTDPGKGNMKVAYLSDASIIDIVSSGKHGLTKFQEEYDAAIAPFLSMSNTDEKNAKIAEKNEQFLPIYRDYIKENSSSLIDVLPSTDVFEVDMGTTLIGSSSSTKLTIDGQEEQQEVNNYKSLDGGNIIVSIEKNGNTTSWNIYTKKEGTSYEVDNSQKLIDPNAPVVATDKPNDVVSDGIEWVKKINSLKPGFMFDGTGAIKDKKAALESGKEALKKLIADSDPTKKELGKDIFNGLTVAAVPGTQILKKREYITGVQKKIGIVGDAADGRRGPKSHAKLLELAGVTQPTQTETAPVVAGKDKQPSINTSTTKPSVIEKNSTMPVADKKKEIVTDPKKAVDVAGTNTKPPFVNTADNPNFGPVALANDNGSPLLTGSNASSSSIEGAYNKELLINSSNFITNFDLPANKKSPGYDQWLKSYEAQGYYFKPKIINTHPTQSRIYLFSSKTGVPATMSKDGFISLPKKDLNTLTLGGLYDKIPSKIQEFKQSYNNNKLKEFSNDILSFNSKAISLNELGLSSNDKSYNDVKEFIRDNSYMVRNEKFTGDEYEKNPKFNLTGLSVNNDNVSFFYDVTGPQLGNNRYKITIKNRDIVDANGLFDEKKFKKEIGKSLLAVV